MGEALAPCTTPTSRIGNSLPLTIQTICNGSYFFCFLIHRIIGMLLVGCGEISTCRRTTARHLDRRCTASEFLQLSVFGTVGCATGGVRSPLHSTITATIRGREWRRRGHSPPYIPYQTIHRLISRVYYIFSCRCAVDAELQCAQPHIIYLRQPTKISSHDLGAPLHLRVQ